MFTMGYNVSSTGQTFYDRRGNPIAIPPHYAADLNLFQQPPAQLRPIKNFLHSLNGIKAFDVQRTLCLGDVLMLVPVVRELKRLGYDVHYQTDLRFVSVLQALGINTAGLNRSVERAIMLDWVVERDHWERALSRMHRCEIFARAVGLEQVPDVWDWSCELGRFPELKEPWAERGEFIVFQGSGAARQRGLSEEAVQWLLTALAVEGVRVLYIGERLPDLKTDPELVRLQFMNGTLRELFSWIGMARCLVTMDSLPLWISHYTKTPVVAILGPSRPEQRIALHPLYPEGAVAVEMNRVVECESCFEMAKKCNYKFDCLYGVSGEQVYELLRPHVMRYLGKEQ